MPSASLSNLPVELFERILEFLDILDVVCLKLLNREAYRAICCSNHIKYRVELFLAGLEDGNHYSLTERQQFLRLYQSNWDSLVPQKAITIAIPDHRTYELAGGVYGLVPNSAPNSVQFYRLPSVSRGIEMEEWSVQDLDFSIDDFTMESAYDLLAALVYKTGRVRVNLLKLSDGKPHPCARNPVLEYVIPLNPTGNGWSLDVIIWESRIGCLFTSALGDQWVDSLVVWDWMTGDLVQVLSQHGSRAFVFLDENTIVIGRPAEDAGPSLCFFDLSVDEKHITPFLTLALLDEGNRQRGSLRIRLNLGLPIRYGPELRVRVPFFVDPLQQMLLIFVFFVDSDGDMVPMLHPLAVPLSALRTWARTAATLVEWNEWARASIPVIADDPGRATFTMGSRFIVPDMDAVIEAFINAQPLSPKTLIPLLVYNLSRRCRVRVEWENSKPHCQGIPGVWNTVAPTSDDESRFRAIEVLAEPTLDALMTEDALIVVEMGLEGGLGRSLTILSF